MGFVVVVIGGGGIGFVAGGQMCTLWREGCPYVMVILSRKGFLPALP